MAIEKHGFAIEDVHLRITHLSMNQQRHADPLHGGEHRRDPAQIAHPRR